MQKTIVRLTAYAVLSTLWWGCNSTDPQAAEHYFSNTERDTLLANVITFMYSKAPAANNQTRFEARFRRHYVAQLPNFRFDRYFIAPDSTHYYFVVRPAGKVQKYRRGIGGKFRLGANLQPYDFEEMWCTPRLSEEEVKQRGRFLFREMVKNGNVDKYLSMSHYIEWPDLTLRYDKKINEWVPTK